MPDNKLAASITIDPDKKTLLIDGEPFPYYLAVGGPVVNPYEPDVHGCPSVTVTILAERVEIVGGVSIDATKTTTVSESRPFGTPPMSIAEFNAMWAARTAPANQSRVV